MKHFSALIKIGDAQTRKIAGGNAITQRQRTEDLHRDPHIKKDKQKHQLHKCHGLKPDQATIAFGTPTDDVNNSRRPHYTNTHVVIGQAGTVP